MEAPKKYWWIVLIAVPLVVAVIQFGPGWWGGDESAPAGVSYVNYGGTQTHVEGDVAFNDLTVILKEARAAADGELSEEFVRTVRAAMENIEAGDFERAIPLLESATDATPIAVLKNNLAAAYLAVGERDRARALLYDAEGTSLSASTAIEHNRRRIRPPAAAALSPWAPTGLSGVVAAVTRCDDDGGMLTVEVTYRNVGTEGAYLYTVPNSTYLLDESSGQTWTSKVASPGHNAPFASGAEYISWVKFVLDGQPPAALTVVANLVQRAFENVSCRIRTD